MKLVDVLVAVLAIFAVFANGALAADIKYKATLPIGPTQRSALTSALNPGLSITSA